jgi:hypothetical protein
MAVRSSVLIAIRFLSTGRFLVPFLIVFIVEPGAIMCMQGLDQKENIMTSSGTETSVCRLSALCFNQQYYPVEAVKCGSIFSEFSEALTILTVRI